MTINDDPEPDAKLLPAGMKMFQNQEPNKNSLHIISRRQLSDAFAA
jgi:hypothetical protein